MMADIEIVSGLIRATKIPQAPKNLLEEIICDADLDYLGRNDFYEIGDKLFKEFMARGVVGSRDEWNRLQISFLEAHRYHTTYARKHRRPAKLKRIRELKSQLN